jgi:DNA-binding transcriptional ArsR family regulator
MKPFDGILGNNCELRIIQFLLPLHGIDFNISELSEEVGVSRPTVTSVLRKLLEYKIIKISRRRSGVNYYEINTDSPFIRIFENLNNLLIEEIIEDDILFQVNDYWEERTNKWRICINFVIIYSTSSS